MAFDKFPASPPPVATRKRGAFAATKLPAKARSEMKITPGQGSSAAIGITSAGKSTASKRAPADAKRVPLGVTPPKTGQAALVREEASALSTIAVYRASPLERIAMIRHGIRAWEAKRLFAGLPIAQGASFKALNLSTATVNKKAKDGGMLSPEESERVIGFAKLVGQLEAMIQESGDPTNFDARAWMARWLTEPLPAFGGMRPADLLDTMEGQGLVCDALAKIQSGAYA